MTRKPLLSLLSLLLIAMAPLGAAQAPPAPLTHIRTTDPSLEALVRDGVRLSATFRRLVERLDRSDVVVYLDAGGGLGAPDGRLTFVSAVGGYRYVHVRVARQRTPDRQIAIIGHELQHAVEIADTPAVVDTSSLARAYWRIGYPNGRAALTGLAFDSHAAVEAGRRILRELIGGAAD